MKFNEHPNSWSLFKKSGMANSLDAKTPEDMYRILMVDMHGERNTLAMRHAAFDCAWRANSAPYYDVYPSVVPMLTALSLEIPGELIKPPQGIKNLVLRLPEGKECIKHNDLDVLTVFMSFQSCTRSVGSSEVVDGICIGIDIGERDETGYIPMFTMRVFPLDHRPIEEAMKCLRDHSSINDGIKVPGELIDECIRLCLTVCLIGDNQELIQPQVLSGDTHKLNWADEERRKQLVDKAKRRGKFAFSLGADIEKSPHFRRPHLATVWTGKGRKIPKIVMRKGSVVHRDKIEQIPTGYDANEPQTDTHLHVHRKDRG